AAERAPREECDSVLGAQLQLVLRAAEPRRELVLHARQLVEDLDRHPDLTDIRVGDAGQLHLALVLQLLQRAHGVLVGHRRVGPALERHGHGAQADGAHLSPRDRPSVHDRHLAAIPGPGSAERGPKRRARTEAQRRPAAPMWQRRTAAPMWQRRPRTCGPTLAPCRTRRAAPSTTPIHTWSRLPTGSSDTPTRA